MSVHTHRIVNGVVVNLTPEEIATIESENAKNLSFFQWNNVREKRDEILKQSDALVLPDRWASYAPEKQASLSTYRQALRDIPQTQTDPANIVWPTPPN
jgi:hypothetical protein